MKKNDFKWNVWNWNFNRDSLEEYDVVPTFMRELKKLKKNKPKTREEFEEFLKSEARYHFWAKCEYEMVVHDWPKSNGEKKVDIYDQLMLNWDLFVDCFWNSLSI